MGVRKERRERLEGRVVYLKLLVLAEAATRKPKVSMRKHTDKIVSEQEAAQAIPLPRPRGCPLRRRGGFLKKVVGIGKVVYYLSITVSVE